MDSSLPHKAENCPETTATGIELQVIRDIARRQQLGIAKYGTTVADNPLSLKQWYQHLYEELLDAAVYTKRAIAELEKPSQIQFPSRQVVTEPAARYASLEAGARPIQFGEPGYEDARYEVAPFWVRIRT